MIRFAKYNGQEEEYETQSNSWTESEHWDMGIGKNKECYVQGWHAATNWKQEKTSSLPSLLNFNESRKVNSDSSLFFNKIEKTGK